MDAMDSRPPAQSGSREEKIAYNEAWSRDLNERKVAWMEDGHPAAGFRCECGQLDCNARFPLSAREWNEIRSKPTRFAVAPGHVAPELERVVEKGDEFWTVEKQG